MVFGDLTDQNANILHKNRDSSVRHIGVLTSPEQSECRWIGLGTIPDQMATMGLNEKGLAIVVNSGEPCIDNNPSNEWGTPKILMHLLGSCHTAVEALDKFRNMLKAGQYSHGESGSIFLLMDTREGYIAECSAHFCSPACFDHGYCLRANIWHNPDMARYSVNTPAGHMNSCIRELQVYSMLNRALAVNGGKIACQDIWAISRNTSMPDSDNKCGVCNKKTNSASTLEINREYPDVLSTMFATIGPPRHTMFLPIPICVTELPDAMHRTPICSDAAFRRFETQGLDFSVEYWQRMEQDMLPVYRQAQADARLALCEGRRDLAIQLLNDAARNAWNRLCVKQQHPLKSQYQD